jgi:hypothetical protein
LYGASNCRTLATSTSTSSGVIVEPFDPTKDNTFFSIDGASTAMSTTLAAGLIRKGIPAFSPKIFERETEVLFAGMNVAFSEGDLGSLDRLVTEQLYQDYKSQIKQDYKRFKHKKGKKRGNNSPEVKREALHVLSYPEPAKIMQMRVVQHDAKDENTAFGQVTVRIRSLRRQTQFDERGNALCARAFFSPKAKEQRGEKKRDDEWKAATSADGKTYYWHSETKETRWDIPTDEDIAGDTSADADNAEVGADASTTDTVSYVVFESPLFGPSKMWRICMVDERGSE